MTAVATSHPTAADAPPTAPALPSGRGTASVGRHLAAIHVRWLAEVTGNLLPACDPRAGFWPRWGAVRYLADRFDRDFALEGELLDRLIGDVEPRAAARLTEGRQALEILRRDLDWIGRRRGTSIPTAAIAGALLQTLRHWCVELERALASLPLDEAAPETAALLAQLDRISQVRGHERPQATVADAGMIWDPPRA